MTDEQLIEKAAIIIAVGDGARGSSPTSNDFEVAKRVWAMFEEAALAVVEEAYSKDDLRVASSTPTETRFTTEGGLRTWVAAPTDDEREALREQFTYRIQEAVAYGGNGERLSTKIRDAWIEGQVDLAMRSHAVRGFRRSVSPDPSAEHAYCGNRSQDTCWVTVNGEMCRKPIEAHPKQQGEPSDAQVEAAARALFEEPGYDPE